jgi:starvation-inducible DNA-binding protein
VSHAYVTEPAAQKEIADALSKLLADTYTLYLKTHNFHWNVTGPQFLSLHDLFMQQYTEMALAVDLIAERIRALHVKAPGSYTENAKLGKEKEEPGLPNADDMVRQLEADNRTVAATAAQLVTVAEKFDDVATADLATQRVNTHEKSAWMLGSILGR